MARLPRLVVALLITALAAPAALAAGPYTPWIGAKVQGNEVVAVISGSPAEVAGLEAGDRILSVDGTETKRGNDVAQAVLAGQIGELSVVRIQRGDRQLSLAVFLAARPDGERTTAAAPPAPTPTASAPAVRDPFASTAPTPTVAEPDPFTPTVEVPTRPRASDEIAPVDLSSYRGDVVVVEFFATWCGACKQTMPTLNGWADRYGDRGLHVVNVSSEDEGLLRRYREAQSLHTVVARDPDGALAGRHGIKVLPTIVVFDRQGKPRGRYVGGGRNLAQIQRLFESLLREGRDDGGIRF